MLWAQADPPTARLTEQMSAEAKTPTQPRFRMIPLAEKVPTGASSEAPANKHIVLAATILNCDRRDQQASQGTFRSAIGTESARTGRCAWSRRPADVSHLDLFVLGNALHGRSLHHAILEGGVVLELAHGQLAAQAPGVEDERIGIEDREPLGEPLAAVEHSV